MKINQISANDEKSGAVVQRMIENSTILHYAEFFPIVGNADYVRKAATASGGVFRALDTDYAANQITPAFAAPTLKILGGKVQVDRAHERRGADVPTVRGLELMSFAENLGRQFQNFFFNGTGANDQFTGLKLIVPAGQKITADTNGHTVTLGSDNTAKLSQQKFIELLSRLIESVTMGAQFLVMDGRTLARLSTIAASMMTVQMNEFGKPVQYFNGIPVVAAGYDKDGARILPHTETVGTGTTCTSVYAMRFGERSNLSIATNVGVEVVDKGLVGVHYEHHVEFDAALALLNDKAVARLEGIIIS